VSFAVAQLTDPHIGADWIDDAAGALVAAVATVTRVLGGHPDAVVVSGDVADTPTDAEYQEARVALDRLGAPIYAVAGNDDDRAGLRRHFDFPAGPAGDQLYYAVDLGPVRLVGLDTKCPGRDGGQLDAEQLTWLDGTLAEHPATPTLVAMHHPPVVTGLAGMDSIGIPEDDRAALAEIIGRHRQVHVIVAGHVHRAVIGGLGGATVLALPSTGMQLAFDIEADQLSFIREPPCIALHLLVDDRLVSHIQAVDGSAPYGAS
jgi:3',5'-cyclic AMP phosphodiesterase CpdA